MTTDFSSSSSSSSYTAHGRNKCGSNYSRHLHTGTMSEATAATKRKSVSATSDLSEKAVGLERRCWRLPLVLWFATDSVKVFRCFTCLCIVSAEAPALGRAPFIPSKDVALRKHIIWNTADTDLNEAGRSFRKMCSFHRHCADSRSVLYSVQ